MGIAAHGTGLEELRLRFFVVVIEEEFVPDVDRLCIHKDQVRFVTSLRLSETYLKALTIVLSLILSKKHIFIVYCSFFFKQKTAYEIGVRLVGSEMCIRDSYKNVYL